jgi:hypothetical protein
MAICTRTARRASYDPLPAIRVEVHHHPCKQFLPLGLVMIQMLD